MYEVEQKYPVDDFERVAGALLKLGAEHIDDLEQVDVYYAHPCRDFAATDEALRIRTVGKQRVVTYKGPKLDATTKTRREIEMPLADGSKSSDSASGVPCEQILLALGFRRVAAVQKRRQVFRLPHQATAGQAALDVEAVLDNVVGVGRYVELEMICPGCDDPAANEGQLNAARTLLGQLATQLDLSKTERRSYLELLLANQASRSTKQG